MEQDIATIRDNIEEYIEKENYMGLSLYLSDISSDYYLLIEPVEDEDRYDDIAFALTADNLQLINELRSYCKKTIANNLINRTREIWEFFDREEPRHDVPKECIDYFNLVNKEAWFKKYFLNYPINFISCVIRLEKLNENAM